MPPPDSVLPKAVRRERNAAATRERLLDAAESEFARSGFAGARLREIADAAGVQSALIHHYFVDKDGLYRAVLDRGLLQSSVDSWNVLANARTIPELVEGFVTTMVDFYAAHPNFLAILRHESAAGTSVLVGVVRDRTAPVVLALTKAIEEHQRAGEIRADVDATEILLAGLSMIVHPFADHPMIEALLPAALLHGPADIERRKRSIKALMLAAIAPLSTHQ